MAKASRTETWDSPVENIYEVLTDYASYVDFVDGVVSVDVHEKSEESAKVTFSLNLIKKIKYTLNLTHVRPTKINWTLDSGDLFKQNDGQWELKKINDNQTEVTYSLEVDIKGFVPKVIVNKLTTSNLPLMMKSYHDRIKGH